MINLLYTQEELTQASKELANYALTNTSIIIKQYLDETINWESASHILCNNVDLYKTRNYSSLGKAYIARENFNATKYISKIRMKREDESYMKAHSD